MKKFDVLLKITGTASAVIYANSLEEAEESAVSGEYVDLEVIDWEADEVQSVAEAPGDE
jgi:hypothetical protein